MSRRVETVAVFGRDAAVWLTAVTLMRGLGRTGLKVHVVDIGGMVSAVDAYPALPTLSNLHNLLGLSDDDVLGVCAGTPCYGQRFANWSRSANPFMHAYDTVGADGENIDFLHYWLRARAEGLGVALEEFSLGAAAAKHGRYVLLSEEGERFSDAAHGYHLSAGPYVRALRQLALRLGATAQDGIVSDVQLDGEHIKRVGLADGGVIEADLFIDATGQGGELISKMPGVTFQSWAQWFGCNRMIAASGKRLSPIPAFAQISAFKEGWLGVYPLQNRTALTAVFDARAIENRDMIQNMSVFSGIALEGEAVTSEIRTGARARSWVGNCIAVGDSAVSLEPLDAAPLHIVQSCISHLMSLFPVDADHFPEAAIYNASVAAHGVNLRDFQIAHYKLNKRVDQPFWDRAREMAIPDSLAYKLDLFARRGVVALYDDEAFQESSWTSLFIGHGLIPVDYDPRADGLPGDALIQRFQSMLRFIADEARAMPSLEAHLEMTMPSRN